MVKTEIEVNSSDILHTLIQTLTLRQPNDSHSFHREKKGLRSRGHNIKSMHHSLYSSLEEFGRRKQKERRKLDEGGTTLLISSLITRNRVSIPESLSFCTLLVLSFTEKSTAKSPPRDNRVSLRVHTQNFEKNSRREKNSSKRV